MHVFPIVYTVHRQFIVTINYCQFVTTNDHIFYTFTLSPPVIFSTIDNIATYDHQLIVFATINTYAILQFHMAF